MSISMWLAPLLVALAGLFASGVFQRADPASAAVLLALAAGAATLASWRAGRRGRALTRAPWGAVAAALALAASAPLLLELGLRFQRVDGFSPFAYVALRGLGFDVRLVDGVLYSDGDGLLAFTTNWGKSGLLPALWIMMACAVVVLVHERPLRTVARVAAIVFAYSVVRYALLVGLALHHPDPGYETGDYPFVIKLFLHSGWQALTFLPLVLFLARFVPWRPEEVRLRSLALEPGRRLVAATSMAVLAAAGGAVSRNYQDPGVLAQGRVVVDERHSRDWSPATAALDTEHYGRDSVYNYTGFVRFLEQYYDVRVNVDEEYSEESLAEVDVLVLKTATAAFLPSEVDAIESFVRRGGGLFVIGDHTDLLGMSTNLNAVTTRFGMAFRPDACNRLEDGQAHEWVPLPWQVHPMTAGSERIEFMTSCTLDVPPDAEPVLIVRNAFSDPLDYAAPSFFGNVAPDVDDDLGLHVVAAARKVDRGRVALFGDSTIFSSFGLTFEGRSEFLLRAIDWLDRANAGGYRVNRGAGRAALVALAVLVLLGVRLSPAFWGGVVPAALLAGGAVGVALCAHWNGRSYTVPRASAPLPSIAFLDEQCDYSLPSPFDVTDDDDSAFDAMFTWTQRLGFLPVLEGLPAALERDALVAIRPSEELVRRRGLVLEEYVRAGGALMLLADDLAAVAPLLVRFGLEPLAGDGAPACLVDTVGGAELPFQGPLSRAVRLAVGDGTLVVVLEPSVFSRVGMGNQIDPVPEADPRLAVFEELYGLVRSL